MQTPPEIVFEGVPASPQIKDVVDAHLAELERRLGRITACRVLVKGPGQRHRQCHKDTAGRRAAFRPYIRGQ